MIGKINTWKYQLEMLAELATFCSQYTKTFKHNVESAPFLRENSNLKWHKLAYLLFKFFYCSLILF